MLLRPLLSAVWRADGSAGTDQRRRRIRAVRSDVETVPDHLPIAVYEAALWQHRNDQIDPRNHDLRLVGHI